ncbi:MAG TPA: SDR family oxidoreductase [Kofleriaceae bacterium]
MKLDQISALITGAASGIGRCFALELATAGATVIAGDIDEDGLDALVDDARGLAGSIRGLVVDVSREDSVQKLVAAARAALGHAPSLLVNNAAILRDGLLVHQDEPGGWVRQLPTSQWKAVLDTNLNGPYYAAREVAAAMLEGNVKPALIVNISSITSAGKHGQSNYAAAKAGLDAVTRTWSLELAPYGIRVAAIAPGLTDTPMAAGVAPDAVAEMLAGIPLGRMARPDEIWAGLKFIIECDYFTGRVLAIDGGASFL